MKKKRWSAEQILKILHKIDASQAQGSTVEKEAGHVYVTNDS